MESEIIIWSNAAMIFYSSCRRNWIFVIVAFVLSGLTGAAHSQERKQEDLDSKIAGIHKTANWRFVDKRFIETIDGRKSELQGTRVTVEGVVRDGLDRPVEGAFVLLRLVSNISYIRLFDELAKDVFASTWSDHKGEFKFENHPTPWFEPTHPLAWELCVFAPGHAMETRRYSYLDGEIRYEKIELQSEQIIEGTVKEPNGKPITNCAFALVEIVNPYNNADIENSLLRSEMRYFVQPNQQGRFQIGGLPPGRIATLLERQGMDVVRSIHIATSADLDPKKMITKGSPRAGLVYPYSSPNFEIVTYGIADKSVNGTNHEASKTPVKPQPTRTVTVRVVNVKDGSGVSGVAVGWQSSVKELRISPGMLVTDKDGTARLGISPGSVDVFIGGRRFGFVTPYGRITSNPQEYTPTVERSDWVRTINPGKEDVAVTFELQPVPPLQINVKKQDGTPIAAELRIARQEWPGCEMPKSYTNERGQAAISIRPVLFDIEITATTNDGLRGNHRVTLSKNLNDSESVTVTVR